MAAHQVQDPIAPIDPAGEIRVFILEPGFGDEKLRGRFEIVTFDPDTLRPFPGSIEWEAISYVWGGQTPSETIEVDTGRRLVTENVASILRNLRRSDQARHLWIDGVCINQDDNYEKPQQVAIMLQVYQSARSVIICLKERNTEIRGSLAAAKWLKDLLSGRGKISPLASNNLRECFDIYCQEKNPLFGITTCHTAAF